MFTTGSPLPDKFPHIFFEVAFEVLPEVNYDDIIYLSQLVKTGKRETLYVLLVDAVRKIQWKKLSALDASFIDSTLAAQYDGSPDVVLHDPIGQIRHAKALLELVSVGKAALDSLAVFLNDLTGSGYNGGERDFRREGFKKKVAECHPSLEQFLRSESEWLQLKGAATTSIVSARDEWIHRGFPDVALMWPPSEVGVLPIPKSLTADDTISATRATHHSTQEFCEFHYFRMIRLLEVVISMSMSIERERMPEAPPKPPKAQQRVSAVKMFLTREMPVRLIQKIGPFSAQ